MKDRLLFEKISFSGFVTTLPKEFNKQQDLITAFWDDVTKEKFEVLYEHINEYGPVGVFFNETESTIDYMVGVVGHVENELVEVVTFTNVEFEMKKNIGPLPESMRNLVIEVEKNNTCIRPSFESYPGADATNDNYESFYYYRLQ